MADRALKMIIHLPRLFRTVPFAFSRKLPRNLITQTSPVWLVRLGYSQVRMAGNTTTSYSPEIIEERMKYIVESRDVCASLQLFDDAKLRGVTPLAKSFASLLHLCCLCGRHEELDHWFQEMQLHYNYIGEGVRAILINSYCARQEWRQALDVLDSLKAENILRHTRSYVPLIRGLAEAGHIRSAFRLFQEKLEHHRETSKKDKQLITDSGMLVALIKSCYQRQNVLENKTPPDMPLFGDDKMNNQKTASSDGKCGDFNAHEDEKTRYNRALEVFDFFQNSGCLLQDDVLEAVKEWFQLDTCNTWKWAQANINRRGVCSNCGTKLASGIPTEKALQLSNELLHCLTNIHLSGLDSKPDELRGKLSKFQEFVKVTGPFDIIVDGPNIGYTGYNLHSSKKTFHAQYLIETVRHFTGKKILLLANVKALGGDKSAIESLKNVSVVVKNSYGYNDLDILYAAAHSGMGQVFVVTNDRLRDHRLLLSNSAKWTYLRWTRENSITVQGGLGGKLQFKRNQFDPVFQRTDGTFHIPLMDRTWRCVQKTSIKRS